MRTISMHLVWPFGRVARRMGVGADTEATLQPSELASPEARIPWEAGLFSIDEIIRETGNRDVGLIAARATQPLDLGPMARVVMPQANLGDAIATHDRFYPLLTDAWIWGFERREGLVYRTFYDTDGAAPHPAVQEFSFSVWATLGRFLTGRKELNPHAVYFTHPRPADTALHERAFRCPIHFDAPVATLVLDEALLKIPCIFADAVEAKAFERRAEAELRNLPSLSASELVGEHIARLLPHGAPTPKQIARKLGLSPRSLQRRLQDENTNYRELLEHVRERMARHYLSTDMSTADIADRLGFSSVHAFQRAFKRRTGRTPVSVRKALQAPEHPRLKT